jgi:hypothetical protein
LAFSAKKKGSPIAEIVSPNDNPKAKEYPYLLAE